MKNKSILNINVIALILTVLGIIAPMVWDRYSSSKSMSVARVSSTNLVKSGDEESKNIKIYYNDIQIRSLNASVFLIENTGSMPIQGDDVKSPLHISYGQNVSVLGAEIIDQRPKDLGANVYIKSDKVFVEFPLFNESDRLSIKVITSDDQSGFDVGGRISGVSQIDRNDTSSELEGVQRVAKGGEYVVFLATIIFVVLTILGIRESLKIRKFRRSFDWDGFFQDADAAKLADISEKMSEIGYIDSEIKGFRDMVKLFISEIDIKDKNPLRKAAMKYVEDFSGAESAAVMFFFLSCGGAYYSWPLVKQFML